MAGGTVLMGMHSATTHWAKRYPNWAVPTAVQVDQIVFSTTRMTTIGVWLQSYTSAGASLDCHGLTVQEARALAQGLLDAAALVESICPARCQDCAAPIDDGEYCIACVMAAEKAARPQLRAV